ncbi:MAG TPA: ATP-binding protein [Dehalococcoidia bacterium]|nr:ATP-binding protein [Dehalococcoidia bacterium]
MSKQQGSEGQKLRDLKFMVATRMLDHIGVSMYSKYPKAIGELVVNGYDADANYVYVNISTNEDKIVIEDNGDGMDETGIRECYMFLGSGQKRAIKRTPIYSRLPIGNKGIGKLAGFGIAKRIEIRTIKDSIAYEFCLDRDEIEKTEGMGKLREPVLDRASMQFRKFDAKGKSNGTIVTLRKLRPECGRIETDKVISHIARELPIGKDFRVLVNGRACEPKDIPASRKIPVDHSDPICGPIVGEILIAKKMLHKPGVFTTVRGRVVGDPSFFDLSPTSFTYHVADLITGSIEVAGFDPEDDTGEMPVIRTDREGFVVTHPKYQAYSKYMTKLLKDICNQLEKEREYKAEAEKKAKVDEAIKHVAEDFNAYEDLMKKLSKQESTLKGKEDDTGRDMHKPELEIETKKRLERKGPKKGIPPAIMQEIKAILGSGRLRFKNQTYQIKTWPLGEDFPECDIRAEESLVLVNLNHPAYDQGVEENCIEITVFRAIAAAFAREDSDSSDEMYEKLDNMIRFQAKRMKARRAKKGQAIEDIDLSPVK